MKNLDVCVCLCMCVCVKERERKTEILLHLLSNKHKQILARLMRSHASTIPSCMKRDSYEKYQLKMPFVFSNLVPDQIGHHLNNRTGNNSTLLSTAVLGTLITIPQFCSYSKLSTWKVGFNTVALQMRKLEHEQLINFPRATQLTSVI